jgi:DNA invertase Pin-like site-specific DNA recombinase
MLAVLGGLADVERDLIRTRIAEGRSRAKAQGKHMGRPLPSPRHSRKRPPDSERRALPCES